MSATRPKRTVVKAKAGGPATTFTPIVRVPAAEDPAPKSDELRRNLTLSRFAKLCLYREQCGCVYANCDLKGRKVTLHDCVDCLKATVEPRAAEAD